MRRLRILALAATLAAANCMPATVHAQEQPSPESMEAAQALFALLFAHGFATLNAQAVEAAWPGIETALRTQRRPGNARRLAPGIRAHPSRAAVGCGEGSSSDLRALSQRRGHAGAGCLLRHRDRREDVAGNAQMPALTRYVIEIITLY